MSPRPRTCKCGCGEKFIPVRPLQVASTMECAIRISRVKRQKAERIALRKARSDAKPLSWYKTKAQNAVNALVRERDRMEPCISCGRWHDGQWHAGHYMSVGSHPELRYEPDNIHRQCQPCNSFKGGNLIGYRPRIISKIGLERVEWLEGPHAARHFTRDDLRSIEADAKEQIKVIRVEA